MFKKFISVFLIIAFSSLLYAQEQVPVAVTGFGGGLPSSYSTVDISESTNKTAANGMSSETLTWVIIGGTVLFVGAVVFIALAKADPQAATECSNDFCNSCSEELVSSCEESLAEACSKSLDEACGETCERMLIPFILSNF